MNSIGRNWSIGYAAYATSLKSIPVIQFVTKMQALKPRRASLAVKLERLAQL
jgi:hypothetical protein